MTTDTQRLDFLEKMGNGMPWWCRESTQGRGYRLHNSPDTQPFPHEGKGSTAREAIDTAMAYVKKQDG